MELLDSTLREGELTRGVLFSQKQKIEIATLLDKFGVNVIEAGQPFVSKQLKESVKKLSSLKLNAQILGHARALKQDVDAVLDCNCDWVGIFISTSDIGIKTKYNLTKEQVLEKGLEAVEYAKSHGLKIRFTPEDGTRTKLDYFVKICNEMESKADRISLADTVGTMTPEKMKVLVEQILQKSKIELNVHCHNDFGLATANCLAAFEAGAKLADVTVNGLGERAGITPLAELAVSLDTLYNAQNGWNFSVLPELSRLVGKYSGLGLARNAPIVGRNAFSHKAGLHTNAVLKNPESYEVINPEKFARKRTIVVDQFAGKKAFENKLNELGVKLDEKKFLEVFQKLKESKKRWVKDADIITLVENGSGEIKSGKKIKAVISIKSNQTSSSKKLSKELLSMPFVEKVLEVAGNYDILAFVKTKNVSELDNLIDKINSIKKVKKTNSRIIMSELNGSNN